MEEQLILFETAKLAKKKSFNEGSRKSYTFEGNLEEPYYGSIFKNLDNSNSLEYEAPTQTLLQKWLREKYYIALTIDPMWIRGGNIGYSCANILGASPKNTFRTKYFKTYEEALEVGLIKGLKLIKL